MRLSIARTKVQVDRASSEVASGRHYDMGLAIGRASGQSLDLRHLVGELETIGNTNAIVSSRLQSTQSALAQMVDLANGLFTSATTVMSSGSERSLFIEDAKAKLGTLVSLLSTTSNGSHLFGGANTSVAPLADYLATPASAARTAVIGTFTTAFGFPPDDPQAVTIGSAAIDGHLNGAFAQLFEDPQWLSAFSVASDVPMRERIAPGEVVETQVSANSPGVRTLVSSLVAVIDSGAENLGAASFASLAAFVAEAAAGAASELAESQSRVGFVQERIERATDRISTQKMFLEKNISQLEDVDAAEASTRLTLLMTKLETSYALTARLQKLSILSYL
jgi:flagellar hook-associated protein 3 FlgL